MNNLINLQIRHSNFDPKTGLLMPAPWKDSNTLLKQFIQSLLIKFSGVSQYMKEWDGTSPSVTQTGYDMDLTANTQTYYGILIGTGINAVTREDCKLQTQVITNIIHGAVSFELLNPSADDWHMLIHRAFTNNTGAPVDVKEVGLISIFPGNPYLFLLDRTLYAFTIGISETKTVTYKIQI